MHTWLNIKRHLSLCLDGTFTWGKNILSVYGLTGFVGLTQPYQGMIPWRRRNAAVMKPMACLSCGRQWPDESSGDVTVLPANSCGHWHLEGGVASAALWPHESVETYPYGSVQNRALIWLCAWALRDSLVYSKTEICNIQQKKRSNQEVFIWGEIKSLIL